MRRTNDRIIKEGIVISSINEKDDYCEECGEDTSSVDGEYWWSDQDGTYIICQECGHENFYSNGMFDEE